jgi:hypothetical protein
MLSVTSGPYNPGPPRLSLLSVTLGSKPESSANLFGQRQHRSPRYAFHCLPSGLSLVCPPLVSLAYVQTPVHTSSSVTSLQGHSPDVGFSQLIC